MTSGATEIFQIVVHYVQCAFHISYLLICKLLHVIFVCIEVVKISHGFILSFAKHSAAKFVFHYALHGTFTRCRISRLWGPFKWSMETSLYGEFLMKKKHCSPNGVKVHLDVRPHLLGHCAVQFLASLCFSEVPNNHLHLQCLQWEKAQSHQPKYLCELTSWIKFFFSQWVLFFL